MHLPWNIIHNDVTEIKTELGSEKKLKKDIKCITMVNNSKVQIFTTLADTKKKLWF